MDLDQVLSNLAQVSEQVKRSTHASRAHGGAQSYAPVGSSGGVSAWAPAGGAGLGFTAGGSGAGGASGAEGKLQQYKQQLHVLQDTLLQSAQSECGVGGLAGGSGSSADIQRQS